MIIRKLLFTPSKGFLMQPVRREAPTPLQVTPDVCSVKKSDKLVGSPESILVYSCLNLSLGL